MKFDFRFSPGDEEVMENLGILSNKAKVVMARAMSRAAATGGKVIKQEVTKKYRVRSKDVQSVMRIKKTSPMVTRLVFKDGFMNLFAWTLGRDRRALSPKTVIDFSSGYPNPLFYKARILRNSGYKKLDGDTKPFIQITKSGYVGLFQRVSKDSREIRGVAGPAISQMVKNEQVMERFYKETSEMYRKRLFHEMDFELNKAKLK